MSLRPLSPRSSARSLSRIPTNNSLDKLVPLARVKELPGTERKRQGIIVLSEIIKDLFHISVVIVCVPGNRSSEVN